METTTANVSSAVISSQVTNANLYAGCVLGNRRRASGVVAMSKFPKRYLLPDGSIYIVTLENVRADYAFTVRQFDDLSAAEQDRRIAEFDEVQAEQWMGDQWEGNEILAWGTDTGQVDQAKRDAGLRTLKHSCRDFWACELKLAD